MVPITDLIVFNLFLFGIPAAYLIGRVLWRRYGFRYVPYGFIYKWGLQGSRLVHWLFFPRSHALQAATPSRDLVPLFAPYVREGTILWSIGTDFFYFHGKNGKFWLKWLSHWAKNGCDIRYLILPVETSERAHLPEHPDRFAPVKFFPLKQSEDLAVKALQDKYLTVHPTILTDANGEPLAVWIEHYHPVGTTVAHDIEFLAPIDARDDPRTRQFLVDIRKLVEEQFDPNDIGMIEDLAA